MVDKKDRSVDGEQTETVRTHHGKEDPNVEGDVASDPAHDDRIGSDWVDEGGATQSGPATDTKE